MTARLSGGLRSLRADVGLDEVREVLGQVHDRPDRDVQARLRTLRLAVQDPTGVGVELVRVDAGVELPADALLVEVGLDLGVAADAWSGGSQAGSGPSFNRSWSAK
jgi:hypothetical protein